MDPNSGRIHQVSDDEEAKRRGLILIPKDQFAAVEAMGMPDRMNWAHRSMTDEERRAAKNARKRQRRARRNNR